MAGTMRRRRAVAEIVSSGTEGKVVKRLLRANLALGLLLWGSQASAAIDWCRILPWIPSRDVSFQAAAAGLATLGCASEPQQSAHARFWICSNREANDGYILLLQLQARFGQGPVILVVKDLGFGNMSPLRQCLDRGVRITTPDGFESSSIAVRDRVTVTRDYLPQTVFQLGIADENYLVAFHPERADASPVIEEVEQGLFGISRPSYPTTSVEIAGQNLLRSSAAQVVASLEARGAHVLSRTEADLYRGTIELSPPIGLDGVTKVTVRTAGAHIVDVEYAIRDNAAYLAYVEILDQRYGRSTARVATASERRDCRDRYWESGTVSIGGTFCTSSGYRLLFLNRAVFDQIEQYGEFLRRPRPANRPRIDPDNL